MADWVEVHGNFGVNSEIAASSSEVFGNTTTDRENKNKYGSYNTLLISSTSAQGIRVSLDGIRTYGLIAGAGAVEIKPEDGLYFDFVEITNLSGSTVIDAGDVNVRYAISLPRNSRG